MIRAPIFFVVLLFFLITPFSAQAIEKLSEQYKSIEDIEGLLANQESGGFFDFGNYTHQKIYINNLISIYPIDYI